MPDTEWFLDISDVRASYGYGDILRGCSLRVPSGKITCVIGPNGAGKSTLLKTISGLLRPKQGEIRLRGDEVLSDLSPREILKRGVVQVAQHRSLFPLMTVEENVRMGGFILRDKALVNRRLEALRDQFPIVRERARDRAASLSGGQQRMVEVARACVLDPQLVLLDEPTLGLDPRARRSVFETAATLRDQGRTVLMVEQNARSGLEISDLGVVMELGKVRLEAPAGQLLDMPEVASLYLGGSSKLPQSESIEEDQRVVG